MGDYHLAKKSENFGFYFPENQFGNCGLPPEIVLFFRSEWNVGNVLTICFNCPFPGPFKDLCAVLVIVQYGSLMVSAISSGWSPYSENPLPLCNSHKNRIFLTNGKHPMFTDNLSRNSCIQCMSFTEIVLAFYN